ncbi:MAG: amidohydrolase family protein [Acidimicrobiales bacterium]
MPLSIQATVLQTPEPGRVELLPRQLITVDDDGMISDVSPVGNEPNGDPSDGGQDGGSDRVVLPDHHVLLPGMIDSHIHAPQWPQLGTGLDLPLEQWLFDYTFPLEARCDDLDYATRLWDSMVPSLLGLGTTTAVYYGSTHEPATLALAEACVDFGQRAFVGRVAMDHPDGTPEWYRDTDANTAVSASHRSVEAIRALPGAAGLVHPIITPRFIPACSDSALGGLAELAEATGALVQTHCSESDWEHNHVIDRHGCSDAHSLHRFGLIRDHTVLAHATHLSDDDRQLLIERGAGVAHCPLSNSYFANAVFPARRSLDAGLRVGLGTDIAGGPEASLLGQCGHAVTSSRMLDDGVDVMLTEGRGRTGSRIDISTAFYMATVGGANLLGIPAGLLAPGRHFDAFSVDLTQLLPGGPWAHRDDKRDAAAGDQINERNSIQILERIVRTAAIGAIDQVWVGGRDVTPAARS